MNTASVQIVYPTADGVSIPSSKELQSGVDPRVVQSLIIGLVASIGILGNSFVVVFFGFLDRNDITASKVFILGVATVDLIVCCIHVPSALTMYFIGATQPFSHTVGINSLGTWTIFATALLVQAMAWERYLAICRPHTFTTGVKKALKICSVVLIGSVILTFLSVYPQETEGVYQEGILSKVYGSFIVYAVTVVTVVVLYALIWRKISQQSKIRDHKIPPVQAAGQSSKADKPTPLVKIHSVSKNNGDSINSAGDHPCSFEINASTGTQCAGLKVPDTDECPAGNHMYHADTPGSFNDSKNSMVNQSETCNLSTDNKIRAPTSQQDMTSVPLARKVKPAHAHIRMVTTLFMLSVIFIISWLPLFLYGLGLVSPVWRILVYLNNIGNPFLYAVVNAKFRTALFKVIECKKP